MSNEIYLTSEGAVRMREELARLTGIERKAIAKRLRDAIQQGDLSENADYSKAKEDQAFLEGRIQELEYMLKNATIVDEVDGKREIIDVGARVTVQEEDYPPETYFLVGIKEADPSKKRISNESPIGKALIGKREGQIAIAETPGGQVRMKVLKIE